MCWKMQFIKMEKTILPILKTNETKQVKLTIGQRFSVEEGEVVFKYIEILSGVSKMI